MNVTRRQALLRLSYFPAIFVAVAANITAALVGVMMVNPPAGDGPMVVVAMPWGPSAEDIARAAGAMLLGPSPAPLSTLAIGATAARLHDAGAWVVLNPEQLPFLCNSET